MKTFKEIIKKMRRIDAAMLAALMLLALAIPVDIIKNAIREYLSHWLICTKDTGIFRKGEHYWLELLEDGNFCGRSDNVKERLIDLSLRELFNNFVITNENI